MEPGGPLVAEVTVVEPDPAMLPASCASGSCESRRPMRARAAVVLVSILALPAACDDPPPRPSGAASASAALSPQPLRFPVIGPGERCPTATAQAWSGPGQAAKVLGDGPLYPIADYFGGDAVLELRDDERGPDGSYEKKVRWLGVGYAGPVLLRAARIDGPGAASARFSYVGSSRDGGHYAELIHAENDLPATTTVSGPGCYAYQVDGTTFSKTIVFGVVEAPRRGDDAPESRESRTTPGGQLNSAIVRYNVQRLEGS